MRGADTHCWHSLDHGLAEALTLALLSWIRCVPIKETHNTPFYRALEWWISTDHSLSYSPCSICKSAIKWCPISQKLRNVQTLAQMVPQPALSLSLISVSILNEHACLQTSSKLTAHWNLFLKISQAKIGHAVESWRLLYINSSYFKSFFFESWHTRCS